VRKARQKNFSAKTQSVKEGGKANRKEFRKTKNISSLGTLESFRTLFFSQKISSKVFHAKPSPILCCPRKLSTKTPQKRKNFTKYF